MYTDKFQPIDTGLIIDRINTVSKDILGGNILPEIKSYSGWLSATLPVEVGEGEAMPRIYLRNRNDGRTALKLSIGFYRIVCMNGLIAGDGGYSERIIHRKGPKIDRFINSLDNNIRYGITHALTSFDGFKSELENIQLTYQQGINIIGWLPMVKKAKTQAIRFWLDNASRRDADKGYTAWQLYNLVNELDRVYSKSGPALERENTRVQDLLLLTQSGELDYAC